MTDIEFHRLRLSLQKQVAYGHWLEEIVVGQKLRIMMLEQAPGIEQASKQHVNMMIKNLRTEFEEWFMDSGQC